MGEQGDQGRGAQDAGAPAGTRAARHRRAHRVRHLTLTLNPTQPLALALALQVLTVFHEFDTTNDGEIDIQEFKGALQVLGMKLGADKARKLFGAFDKDNNNTVGPVELPPHISLISRPYLAHLSPTSRPHLAHISPTSRPYLPRR